MQHRLTYVVIALLAAALAVTTVACSGDPVRPAQPAPIDTLLDVATPTPSDTAFAELAVASALSCALTRGGRAYCWGSDGFGSLGTVAMHACPSVAYAS